MIVYLFDSLSSLIVLSLIIFHLLCHFELTFSCMMLLAALTALFNWILQSSNCYDTLKLNGKEKWFRARRYGVEKSLKKSFHSVKRLKAPHVTDGVSNDDTKHMAHICTHGGAEHWNLLSENIENIMFLSLTKTKLIVQFLHFNLIILFKIRDFLSDNKT